MWKQFIIPLIAVGGVTFAINHVVRSQQPPTVKSPLVEPPRSPFATTVAGAGIIEARSDASNTANIAVGSELSGVVSIVCAKVGAKVKAGDLLFELDDRQMRAELAYREANLAASKAQLVRLEQMPRPEEVPPSEAKLREAESNVKLQSDQLARADKMIGSQSIGAEDWVAKKQGLAAAEGNWLRLRPISPVEGWRLGCGQGRGACGRGPGQAQVTQTLTDLDRRIVRPGDGHHLAVNLRPGEFVGTPPNQPLIVLGDIDVLHVRVDIDENDIHRFRPGMKAMAKLRGDPSRELPLRFVRVEPYVIPKKSLTGDNIERVDTRVLQVIYSVDAKETGLYVGQQVDVFLSGEE